MRVRPLRLLVIAAALLVASSAGADDYESGMAEFAAGRYAEAVSHFETGLAARPGNSGILYMLALGRSRAGRTVQAEAAFAELLAQELDDPALVEKAWANRLRNLIDGGRLDQGASLLAVARAAAPGNAEVLYQGARASFDAGKLPTAISLLEEATRLDSEHWAVFNLLGLAWLRSGNPGAARLALERAAQLAPQVAFVYNNLGAAREAQGDLVGAETAYRRAFAIEPSARVKQNLERVHKSIAGNGGQQRWVLEESP